MADEQTDWKWDTYDAVDVEVKLDFIKSKKIFKKYSTSWRQNTSNPSLCKSCSQACMSCESFPESDWTKTKECFEKLATAPGCHLCVMIAHAFDEQSVDAFRKLDDATEIELGISFRSSQRDPDGKLTWEQRTGFNLRMGENGPDEFLLRI
jgi:hypothetical protein